MDLTTAYDALIGEPSLLVARIPGYIPADVCAYARGHIIPEIMRNSSRRIYRSQVEAFTDAFRNGEQAIESYLERAPRVIRELREAFHPYANPADTFRSEIEELAPYGAQLLRFRRRPVVFGMMRSWDPLLEALPHFDMLSEFNPALDLELEFFEQFGVNMHLEAPCRGGELNVWDKTLDSMREVGVSGENKTYGFDPARLPEPDVTIRPSVGDLIIVKSTRLHSVSKTDRGRRVTISGFLGLTRGKIGARLWS
ncbi:hypothetical protein [Spongiactinospora sp. TRM90649]|uniref:2OG-Fe(II)-dependent halogenase WelO5 family protein n=1 Tax=Spongiactinospora sp. TRM90649 TaxID=3031114 RepID=UPI0023F63900|nr:hypothetical protein [Spongiactinospora sp. TRM90649]MDF5751654.1 hypothetical protein [Spongiactinospora sp. TRM90649]